MWAAPLSMFSPSSYPPSVSCYSSWILCYLIREWSLVASFGQAFHISLCSEWLPRNSLPHEPWGQQHQFSSVTQLCLILCDLMDCSMPGLPVHHQLLEFTQTHVHWVGDAIQPSHPLSSPFSLSFNLSQHQGLFKWVSSLHHVAKLLEF